MIKLLQRTETEKSTERRLYQQADIGKRSGVVLSFPFYPTAEYNCYYCRYKKNFLTQQAFDDCMNQHMCNYARLPFILKTTPIISEIAGEYENPDGTYLDYHATGIYKQVTFEAQPNHVQLFLCDNGQAQCNASCWWHQWRLSKKRTWRQCGETHLCQNDGSLWVLMVPTDAALREEYLNQF